MAWTQVCYSYDGSFAGFLTCVFESYVHHEEPVDFSTPDDPRYSFYPERAVTTDEAHAKRVFKAIGEKMGPRGRELTARGFLTCLPERELRLWQFLRKGFAQGRGLLQNLVDPVAFPIIKAVQALEHEAHLFTGFVRFSELDGVLAGEIAPKNRVLPLVRSHFCSRYPGETFVLYDRTHGEALFHRPGAWKILPLADFELAAPGEEEREYRALWRKFYDTIAIEGRRNERCRMTHMPKRFWADMTEFQRSDSDLSRELTPHN